MAAPSAIADDVLTIEEVSQLLRCSVDTVRRIPLEELPVYRVGRHNLYLKEEVIRFLRTRRVERPGVDLILDQVMQTVEDRIPGVIDSEPADARRRSQGERHDKQSA